MADRDKAVNGGTMTAFAIQRHSSGTNPANSSLLRSTTSKVGMSRYDETGGKLMGDFDCCADPTATHSLDEARWKLAQIRDAIAWADEPAVILAGISNILENTEPTA